MAAAPPPADGNEPARVSYKFGNDDMYLDLEEEFWNACCEEFPFVEEAVSFEFGDDYGNSMFLDLEKELDFERCNYGRGLCADVFAAPDHLSDDAFLFDSPLDLDFWQQ